MIFVISCSNLSMLSKVLSLLLSVSTSLYLRILGSEFRESMVPEKIFVLVTWYYYLLFGDVIIKTSDTLKFKYLKNLPLPASVRGSII